MTHSKFEMIFKCRTIKISQRWFHGEFSFYWKILKYQFFFITTVRVLGVSYLVRILSAAESKWPLGPRMKVG